MSGSQHKNQELYGITMSVARDELARLLTGTAYLKGCTVIHSVDGTAYALLVPAEFLEAIQAMPAPEPSEPCRLDDLGEILPHPLMKNHGS